MNCLDNNNFVTDANCNKDYSTNKNLDIYYNAAINYCKINDNINNSFCQDFYNNIGTKSDLYNQQKFNLFTNADYIKWNNIWKKNGCFEDLPKQYYNRILTFKNDADRIQYINTIATNNRNICYSGEGIGINDALYLGNCIYSQNKKFKLCQHPSGLVLYNNDTNIAKWISSITIGNKTITNLQLRVDNNHAFLIWDSFYVEKTYTQYRPDGPIKHFNSQKCLDLPSGNTGYGTPIQIWDCNGTAAQQFRYNDNTQTIQSVKDPSMCIDINAGSNTLGTKIQLWGCNRTSAQQFRYNENTTQFESQVGNDRCIGLPMNNSTNGTNVTLHNCVMHPAKDYRIPGIQTKTSANPINLKGEQNNISNYSQISWPFLTLRNDGKIVIYNTSNGALVAQVNYIDPFENKTDNSTEKAIGYIVNSTDNTIDNSNCCNKADLINNTKCSNEYINSYKNYLTDMNKYCKINNNIIDKEICDELFNNEYNLNDYDTLIRKKSEICLIPNNYLDSKCIQFNNKRKSQLNKQIDYCNSNPFKSECSQLYSEYKKINPDNIFVKYVTFMLIIILVVLCTMIGGSIILLKKKKMNLENKK
jgi:hypothetical protein